MKDTYCTWLMPRSVYVYRTTARRLTFPASVPVSVITVGTHDPGGKISQGYVESPRAIFVRLSSPVVATANSLPCGCLASTRCCHRGMPGLLIFHKQRRFIKRSSDSATYYLASSSVSTLSVSKVSCRCSGVSPQLY